MAHPYPHPIRVAIVGAGSSHNSPESYRTLAEKWAAVLNHETVVENGKKVQKFDAIVVTDAIEAIENHLTLRDRPRRLIFLSGIFTNYARVIRNAHRDISVYVFTANIPDGEVYIVPKPFPGKIADMIIA